jgi:hypothetical protein
MVILSQTAAAQEVRAQEVVVQLAPAVAEVRAAMEVMVLLQVTGTAFPTVLDHLYVTLV